MPKLKLVWKSSAHYDMVCCHIAALHDRHLPLNQMIQPLTHTKNQWETTLELPADITSSILLIPLNASQLHTLSECKDPRQRFTHLKKHSTQHGLTVEGPGFTLIGDRILGPNHAPRPGWNTPVHNHPNWHHDPTLQLWHCGHPTAPIRLLLLDGQQWAHTALPAALHQLETTGDLPPLEVFAIDTSTDRAERLSRNPKTSAWLHSTIREQKRPTIVAGQSLGALQILDAMLKDPTTVRHALCLSPSLWFPHHAGPLGGSISADLHTININLHGVHLYLSAGTAEGRPPGMAHTMDAHVTHLARQLETQGANVATDITTAAHELCAWEGALTRGLQWIIPFLKC